MSIRFGLRTECDREVSIKPFPATGDHVASLLAELTDRFGSRGQF
jgi:hypothetical protein